jgi:hypothetical protein
VRVYAFVTSLNLSHLMCAVAVFMVHFAGPPRFADIRVLVHLSNVFIIFGVVSVCRCSIVL